MTLKEETAASLEERMKRGGYPTVDDLVQAALQALDELEGEELDEETLDSIDRADEQIARGEYRDWEDVKAELRAKYIPAERKRGPRKNTRRNQ
jgi:Arc/MetJ-type ribon-helix-helix transcriptional regulator